MVPGLSSVKETSTSTQIVGGVRLAVVTGYNGIIIATKIIQNTFTLSCVQG